MNITVMYKRDRQWEFAVRLTELNLVLRDSLEKWDGVGGGKEVQEGGDICILTADSHCRMAETTTTL